MDPVKWFFVCLCFKAVTQTDVSPWKSKVPSSVKGLLGSCVVIPCSFNYPDTDKTITEFAGMWAEEASHQFIYHPDKSIRIEQYRERTELLGDVRQKNCSLKIDPVRESDRGPFYFRIEMKDYDKYSYKEDKVSITPISNPSPIHFSVKEVVKVGETVSASCYVSHSCPTSPPVFTWSLPGEAHVQSQQLDDGQWRTTSTLNFRPTSTNHNHSLQCTVTYKGGHKQEASKILKVEYAPVNVNIEHKYDVKEGEAVLLRCSSDAQPAASYRWQNEAGARLHQGNVFTLQNVSRHTGALFCIANNAMGEGKSNPLRLNVLYVPEIKPVSYCSSEADMVKCVCMAESQPASMVHFVLPDRVLPSITVEKHGSITIGTLRADFGSSLVVYCLANNTLGKANVTLILPVKNKMQNTYIGIASGIGILVMLLITVAVFITRRRRSENTPAPHISTETADKAVALPRYSSAKRKPKIQKDAHCAGIYTNDQVYGNMEIALDDSIYANM